MRVSLRDARPDDSDFVLDVRRAAFRAYAELSGGWDDNDELMRHHERFLKQRFRIVVAGGEDVGYAATAVYPEATSSYPSGLYIHQLMVLPGHQSKGIGSSALRIVAREARGLGIPLCLRVLRVNPGALAFYRRAGFAVTDESESHIALEVSG